MPSRTVTIRSAQMAGGISQQPAHVRFPGQVADANNAMFTLANGIEKRPGTKFIKKIGVSPDDGLSLAAGGSYRMHVIDRDESERYIVIYGAARLRVIRTDGTEASRTDSSTGGAATTYFTAGGAQADSFRLLSIADTTLIANTTVTVATKATPTYTVTAEWADYNAMVANTPADATYHKADGSIPGESAGYYYYNVGGTTFPTMQFSSVTAGSGGSPADWADSTPRGFRIRFEKRQGTFTGASWRNVNTTRTITGITNASPPVVTTSASHGYVDGEQVTFSGIVGATGLNTGTYYVKSLTATTFSVYTDASLTTGAAAPGVWVSGGTALCPGKVLTKLGNWSSYAWQSGDQLNISSGTGWSAGLVQIGSKISSNSLSLTKTDGTAINIAASSDVAGGGISQTYRVAFNGTGGTLSDMNAVAQFIQNKLHASGCADGLIAWTYTGKDTGYFTITGPWRGSGATVAHYSVSLPNPSPPGSGIVDGSTGDQSRSGGPFDGSSATNTDGSGGGTRTLAIADRWTNVPAPGDPDGSIDATTMPIKLTRTQVSPPIFTIDLVPWKSRTSGGHTTNPSPSLWQKGYAISDMTFHRGRFGLSGGENVVFSQANDYYNFYLQDFTQLVDSDPIDLSLSSDRVTRIDFITPFRDTLTVFTKAGRQFELNAPEALTPATASFVASTAYTTLSIRPAEVGGLLYFLSTNGQNTGLMETYFEAKLVSTDAADVTAHVPRLLPTSPRTVVVHANTRQVFVLPTDSNVIYVYKTFFNGTTKVQSAWTKYTFDASYRICDIAVVRDELFLLVESQSQYFLESMPVIQTQPETFSIGGVGSWTFPPQLDRMFLLTSGSYNGGTDKTTFTLPSSASDTTINTAVLPNGTVLAATSAGTTVTVNGDYHASNIVLGRTYAWSTQLSQPFARDQYGHAELEIALIQQRLDVEYYRSGPFSVRLHTESGTDYTQTLSLPAGTYTSTGVFQSWPVGRCDLNTVYIESTSAYPVVISGLQHVCDAAIVGR